MARSRRNDADAPRPDNRTHHRRKRQAVERRLRDVQYTLSDALDHYDGWYDELDADLYEDVDMTRRASRR